MSICAIIWTTRLRRNSRSSRIVLISARRPAASASRRGPLRVPAAVAPPRQRPSRAPRAACRSSRRAGGSFLRVDRLAGGPQSSPVRTMRSPVRRNVLPAAQRGVVRPRASAVDDPSMACCTSSSVNVRSGCAERQANDRLTWPSGTPLPCTDRTPRRNQRGGRVRSDRATNICGWQAIGDDDRQVTDDGRVTRKRRDRRRAPRTPPRSAVEVESRRRQTPSRRVRPSRRCVRPSPTAPVGLPDSRARCPGDSHGSVVGLRLDVVRATGLRRRSSATPLRVEEIERPAVPLQCATRGPVITHPTVVRSPRGWNTEPSSNSRTSAARRSGCRRERLEKPGTSEGRSTANFSDRGLRSTRRSPGGANGAAAGAR